MIIDHKVLSIPPYISTSWKNVCSLHVESRKQGLVLIVLLFNGPSIEVPHLEQSIIDAVFAAHAKFLDQESSPQTPRNSSKLPLGQMPFIDLPFQMENPLRVGGLENLGSLLQHNPDQAQSPDLPEEILNKITAVSKAMGIDDPATLPKAEPHCNCVYCQVARAFQGEARQAGQNAEEKEHNVTEEDLKFRLWDILQTGDKLYLVTNPIDGKEYYNVYLGDPIGCTCGQKNCEHMRAVLNT